MAFVKLASLPAARNQQIAASGTTTRVPVTTSELMVDTSSETRAYVLLENLSNHILRYFYVAGGFSEGFSILPKSGVRIIVREAIYLQLESGSGEVCFDRGEG